jgi:hypothetical protein
MHQYIGTLHVLRHLQPTAQPADKQGEGSGEKIFPLPIAAYLYL